MALEHRMLADAGPRPPRHRGRRARGADRGAPAPGAAVAPAGARAGPVRAPGGRARRAEQGARRCSPTSSGLEPGAELRDLQSAVLRQDPALDWVAPRRRRPRSPPAPEPPPSPPPRHPSAWSRWPPWPMVGRDRRPRGPGRRPGRRGDGRAGVRRADRRPRHRQVPAERRARRGGPGPRGARCWSGAAPRTTARRRCGRGSRCSSGSVRHARRRAGARRTRPAAQFRSRERLGPDGPRRRPRTAACWSCSTTCTGPTSPRCGCCGCWPRPPTDGRCWCSPPGARTPSRPARWPRWPRRWPGGTPYGASWPGWPAADVAEVVETVARNRPSEEQATALRQRTDGNPFFLVEYARLAGERGDLDRLVAEERPAHRACTEVLTRRLERLPDDTVAHAAVGRGDRPRSSTLADAGVGGRRRRGRRCSTSLEPALAAGLVREDGDRAVPLRPRAGPRHRWPASMPPSRRARLHARVGRGCSRPPRPRDRGGPALAGRRPGVRRPGLAGGRGRGRAWPAGCTPTRRPPSCCARPYAAMADDPDATPRTATTC